ncbi:hypothetical protein F511_04161 [Dorcoceras hygrometricum]|uniref:Uncharacterized protein n=1 Tax=Dorcoceras hygrometricum TaxID=472368 RepID=A0A2Z7BPT8_9LAMI|nr:hypothetical protein F511_04161 [Dorcoceras hygrometricum]
MSSPSDSIAELGSSKPPWYEEKSSNLRSSDIPFIKEKGGCSKNLRSSFLVPTRGLTALLGASIISTLISWRWVSGSSSEVYRRLCQHIKISPSRLAPNSYSFLLALPTLIRYHNLPLITYVLMQLVQIKRLDPGKFYLSHKGDHAFIKGNSGSHKGWMSWFFFVKRVGKKRDPWKCDMFWRDNMYTFTAQTPDRSPNLDSFLNVMREKSYNAPELIQEDLLCFFGFSRRGVELIGDLDERMGKEDMLRLMEGEATVGSSGLPVPSKKATKKRRASTPAEKEARREKRKKKEEEVPTTDTRGTSTLETRRGASSLKEPEERPDPTPVINIPEASPEKVEPTERAGPGRVPPLNFFEDSLVVSPSGVVATNLLCHIAPTGHRSTG